MSKKPLITRLACLLVTIVLLPLFPALAQGIPHWPYPQHLPYAEQTIKPNHRSQDQLDADVSAFYEQWKGRYLLQAGFDAEGRPLYRVSCGSTQPGRTVSEGQGYGMIIVSLMAGYDPDAQELFEGLFRFARKHRSCIDPRLMGWEWYKGNGADDSAFDGDADIAYGLMLAHKQWGSSGSLNYRIAAKRVLAGLLESTIGPESRLPMLGDWVRPNGRRYNQYTPRSSDFMPSHFRAFRRFTANPAWGEVVLRSQTVLNMVQQNYSPNTGLLPDFLIYDGAGPKPAYANFLEGLHDGHFYYNAGRIPWRLGMDVLLNNNAASRAQVKRISQWIEAKTDGRPANIKAGYRLDGTPIGNYFTSFFAAPFGVAAMCNVRQQDWLNRLYNSVYRRHEDYYEDSVTMLCLLVMSGNYWDPTKIGR